MLGGYASGIFLFLESFLSFKKLKFEFFLYKNKSIRKWLNHADFYSSEVLKSAQLTTN